MITKYFSSSHFGHIKIPFTVIIFKIYTFNAIKTKCTSLIKLLQENIRLFAGISLGIFLFILFFQPFPLDGLDFNNTLLFDAGFAAIVFLIVISLRIVYPAIIHRRKQDDYVYPSYMNDFFILTLSSVAFSFYLNYVGSVAISFYTIFKVVLICLSIPVVLRLKESNNDLRHQNETLRAEKRKLHREVDNHEKEILNRSIELTSENANENLKLLISEIALFRSADNYVEVVYMEHNEYKKKLIRNTLKNIELQIRPYPGFIRCHRTCIVNNHFIEKLNKRYNNHSLSIRGYEEQIPVSRQYLLKLKEAMQAILG